MLKEHGDTGRILRRLRTALYVTDEDHSKLCIGFPFNKKTSGPKIFLARLKKSIKKQGLANTSHFLLPIYDVGLFSSVARSWYGKPYVLRVDGIYFDKGATCGSSVARNMPIFNSIKGACGVIYQSDFSRKLVERFMGSKKSPSCVIPNGINTLEFSADGGDHRTELGIDQDCRVLITSATWRMHKRLHDILNIFYKLDKKEPGLYRLIILGDPKTVLPRHPGIHCPGFVEPVQLPAWYRTGDVFMFLSWLDSCPNTVLEALSCGIPVVCSNQGGTKEIVERAHGGIIVAADADFLFTPIDLYKPPAPDYGAVIEAVEHVFDDYDAFRGAIDYDELDIDRIAARYVDFVSDCLGTG